MNKVKFTSKQIANWKRTAMNVNANVVKREKLNEKMKALQEEINVLTAAIDLEEAPVKAVTGGYTTSDIFVKTVTDTGKVDANGRAIKVTKYELRYPETILPPTEEGCIGGEEPNNTVTTETIVENGQETI